MSKKLNAAIATGGMAIAAAASWLTSPWGISLRLVVIGIVSIVLVAQATVLFDRYGKSLVARKRFSWAAAVALFPALLALAGSSTTLWMNSVRYGHGPCPQSQGWRCARAEAAREPTVVHLGLSVQQFAGAHAEWFPSYWSATRTGTFSVEPSRTDLRVRIEGFARPTQFGVAYLVIGANDVADLTVSLEPGTSTSLLTIDEARASQSWLTIAGGGFWLIGSLWLYFWPRLKSLMQPPSRRSEFNTPAE